MQITCNTPLQVPVISRKTAGLRAAVQGCVFALQSAAKFRKNFNEDAGNCMADAVYSNSPVLPRGISVIDALAMKENCTVAGKPTV